MKGGDAENVALAKLTGFDGPGGRVLTEWRENEPVTFKISILQKIIMKQRFRLLFLTVVTLFFPILTTGLSLAATFPRDVLSASEIIELVAGKTAEVAFNNKTERGLFYFSLDGKVKQLVNNWLETGVWEVNDKSRLCVRMGGENRDCRMLIRDRDGIGQYVVKKDGNHQRELTYKNFIDGDKLLELERSPVPPLQILDKQAIIRLFSDQTVESETVRKGRVSLTYYHADGTLELMRDGKTYFGVWQVTDNGRMCLKIEDSKEKCRVIVKQGTIISKYIVKNNGQHQPSITYRRFLSGKQF